jgi:hypothetical protein
VCLSLLRALAGAAHEYTLPHVHLQQWAALKCCWLRGPMFFLRIFLFVAKVAIDHKKT